MSKLERSTEPITYEQTGVSYKDMDPFKIAAQRAAGKTALNLVEQFGMHEVVASRGESAYVWDEGHKYGAMVTEGLGTKNLVADAMRKITGKTYYDSIAQDTVAMIVNDLVVVGARPKVVTAHYSASDSEWFTDLQRANDLVNGWAAACNLAGATWGGGETPTLKGILQPGVIELSGSAVGEIDPKDQLVLGEKLQAGDAIILIESSGIHANGLTLAREVADRLPEGYATKLPDGRMYGEALLMPTHIYVSAVRALQNHQIDIHYMSNITGHGWRKLMRANKELTYEITAMPEPQQEFELIQRISGNDDAEMYGNLNMGAGYAIFVPQDEVNNALSTLQEAEEDTGFKAWHAGSVKEGSKKVILKPKGIIFNDDSLQVR